MRGVIDSFVEAGSDLIRTSEEGTTKIYSHFVCVCVCVCVCVGACLCGL